MPISLSALLKAVTLKSEANKAKTSKSSTSGGSGSKAFQDAQKMGLEYMKFGRYGKDGVVTHVSSDGGSKLVPIGDKQTNGNAGTPASPPESAPTQDPKFKGSHPHSGHTPASPQSLKKLSSLIPKNVEPTIRGKSAWHAGKADAEGGLDPMPDDFNSETDWNDYMAGYDETSADLKFARDVEAGQKNGDQNAVSDMDPMATFDPVTRKPSYKVAREYQNIDGIMATKREVDYKKRVNSEKFKLRPDADLKTVIKGILDNRQGLMKSEMPSFTAEKDHRDGSPIITMHNQRLSTSMHRGTKISPDQYDQ